MNEYRRYCITLPDAKQARDEMATMYRRVRADNPRIARLFYRRAGAVEAGMRAKIEELYKGWDSQSVGGLAHLIG